MKTAYITTVAATLLAATLAIPAQAAVSTKAVDDIYKGETEAQVLQSLGTPENAPHWLDGSHSLIYKLKDSSGTQARAYVDVGANGKVMDVQFVTDGSN